MNREDNYLRIPWDYAMWLGGLRWSAAGDAVEYPDGEAFVLNPQIALFLEGLAGEGRFPHFGEVLHLLHLFGHGRVQLWSEDGTLLAAASQSCVVRPRTPPPED